MYTHSTNTFGFIRAIAAFRLTGANKVCKSDGSSLLFVHPAARSVYSLAASRQDHVVLATDSGRIVIAAFNKERKCFEKAGFAHPPPFVNCACFPV